MLRAEHNTFCTLGVPGSNLVGICSGQGRGRGHAGLAFQTVKEDEIKNDEMQTLRNTLPIKVG